MRSYRQLREMAIQNNTKISEAVIMEEIKATGLPREQLMARMKYNYGVMQDSVRQGMTGRWQSLSGLVGGDAARLETFRLGGKSLLGDTLNQAAARAIAVAEVNAGMGRIVAAPTAGSCGVLPGVVLTIRDLLKSSEEEVVLALFTAAGAGLVIADRASVAGAEGGCQAEIGSAAAMAAAAAVELAGGRPEQTEEAAALALKNLLGLVCDPLAGLVEVPCVKRNAMAAVIAMTAAEMSLAGIKSAVPFDEVIDAMAAIGKAMPCSLKETAQGGLAATPTGERIKGQWRA